MAGAFIGDEPVVGVVERDSRRVLRDTRHKAVYSGPLVVLVDEGTASASEVLAGALKDNQRAIVVGSPHTYGKGSVQKLFHLDDETTPLGLLSGKGNSGVVKLTTSIFYSPLGHSPANGGVASHISLPIPPEEDCPACQLTAGKLSVPEEGPFLDEWEMRGVRNRQSLEKSVIEELRARSAERVARAAKKAFNDDLAMNEAVSIAADAVLLERDGQKAAVASLKKTPQPVRNQRRDVVRY